jgi:hypothetical protein
MKRARARKFFEKLFKKVLTNRPRYGIINMLKGKGKQAEEVAPTRVSKTSQGEEPTFHRKVSLFAGYKCEPEPRG